MKERGVKSIIEQRELPPGVFVCAVQTYNAYPILPEICEISIETPSRKMSPFLERNPFMVSCKANPVSILLNLMFPSLRTGLDVQLVATKVPKSPV